MGDGSKRKARQPEAPAPPSHRILTSDELGLLKVSEVPADDKWEETAAKQRWGAMDKAQAITRLAVHSPDWDAERCLVAAAHASGRVTLHSGLDGGDLGSFRAAPPATTSGRTDASANAVVGLRAVRPPGDSRLLLVSATQGGSVAVHACDAAEALHTGLAGRVVRTWAEAARLAALPGNLVALDVGSSGRHVAVGGEGHQLRVWDLAAATATVTATAAASAAAAKPHGEPLFAGKAGKPSRSGLQDLAHVTALAFVPDGGADQLVLVGTAKQKLWLYDLRAGRKPQAELVWGEGRITVLHPQPDGQRVWMGNGRGNMEALDLRAAPAKLSAGHALKGSAGSIRAMALHPSELLIASASLDRHLRVHSADKRAQLARTYLKQELTGVAWLPPAAPSHAGTAAASTGGEEEEDEEDGVKAAAEDEGEEEQQQQQRGHSRRHRAQGGSRGAQVAAAGQDDEGRGKAARKKARKGEKARHKE